MLSRLETPDFSSCVRINVASPSSVIMPPNKAIATALLASMTPVQIFTIALKLY
jgi:hypothetical protein